MDEQCYHAESFRGDDPELGRLYAETSIGQADGIQMADSIIASG